MNNKERLDKAIIAYYGMEDTIMSDEEFDMLFEQEYGPDISPFEIYQKIYKGKGRERTLEKKMLSLKKANNDQELQYFIDKFYQQGADKIFITPKFDGLSALIKTDENGEVVSAITRGNGIVGQDITYVISCVGQQFPPSELIQAEVCLREEYLLEAENITGKEYNHARNAAAGIVRMSNNKTSKAAKLLDIAFHFTSDMYGARTYDLQKDNDKVVLVKNGEICNLEEELYDYKNEYEELGLLTDGVVIVAQKDGKIMRELGDNGKQTEYAFAWKFPSRTQQAYLADIIWQQGRTKKTPVAIFNPPVYFGGTSVSRCTLNNQDFIDNLGVSPGDIVEVALFNEVIPGIVSVIEKGDGIGNPVENVRETDIDNVIPFVRNFLNVLDVYGTGGKFHEDYAQYLLDNDLDIRSGMVLTFMNICDNEDILRSFTGMEKEDSKRRKALHESFIRSRQSADEAQWLSSLGVPFIGIKNASKLIQKQGGIVNMLDVLSDNPTKLEMEGIGAKTLAPLIQYKDEVLSALSYVDFDDVDTVEESSITAQGSVVITGKLDVSRKDAEKILNDNGWDLAGSVSSETVAVITPDASGGSSKLKKAREKNIAIIELQTIDQAIEKLADL